MKIAIASCSKLEDTNPQPVWDEIRTERPDVLLLVGDSVYLDNENHKNPEALKNDLRARYEEKFREPHFSALINDIKARNATLLAIYDDHDFLGNDRVGADFSVAMREVARNEFIHFFSPQLTGNDVYRRFSSELVDIIVLDARYYRRTPGHSKKDPNAMLGAQQWEWLENQVALSTARYLVVATSSTFDKLEPSFPILKPDDSWKKYPVAFKRLKNLLKGRPRSMIVSGDIHDNKLSDKSGVIEVVSSGVARQAIGSDKQLRNYGILSFSAASLRVDLRGLDPEQRIAATINSENWRL